MEGAGERERQLDELAKGLNAWLDSIPITGIPDLPERLQEVDKESKEGIPPEFAQALESGAAKKELKRAFGTEMLLQARNKPASDARSGGGHPVGTKADARQLAAIRARGTFENGDENDKDRKPDVWRISRLLQTGYEVRRLWYYLLLVTALDQIWVQPALRLTGGRFRSGVLSVASGLRNSWAAVKAIANSLVGIRVERFDATAATLDLRRDRKDFCLQNSGAPPDSRLFDPLKRSFLGREWKRIADSRATAWANQEESRFVEEAIKRVREKYLGQGTSEETIAAEVRALSRAEEARRLAAALSDDPNIEQHSPGLGRILAGHVEAAWALSAALVDLQNEEQQVRAARLEELQKQHPVLVHVEHWKEATLQRSEDDWRRALAWRALEEAQRIVAAVGEPEARLVSADREWHQSKLLSLKAAALLDRKYKRPVYTATQLTRIWNRQNFWVEKTRPGTGETVTWRAHESPRHAEERGDLLGASDLESGLAFEIERRGGRTAGFVYSLRKYDRRNVSSGGVFWRLRLLRDRTVCNFKNGVHDVGVQLWSGSLGIRALFALRPFQVHDWTVDRNTGTLSKVQTAERHTFLNRLSELWSHAYRSRAQFEAEPSTGLIGKGIARPFNLVWNYVVKAALGTGLLCCVIPAATALNALVSLGVIVTSPVWAPGFALLQYLWEVLIFDGVTNRVSPLVIALFWGLGVTGIGNIALSLVFAVLHPVIGAVIYVGGGLGIGVVAGWDWLMFWGLLRWHARIPSSDTFLCRRISGGGIVEMQTYFVQVAPAAVLLALRLHLQTMLLQAQLEALLWDVDAPVREATRIRDVLEPLGVTVSLPAQGVRSTYGRLERIFEQAQALEAEVKKAFAARFRKLEQDPRSDVRNKVRLTREDLHRTLPIAEDVVQHFIAERFLPVRTRYRNGSLNAAAEFWKGQGLTDNDWKGLTRKLLALSVSDGVLTPLEDDAQGLHLRVEHVTPREYIRMLVDNEVHDDLEVARVVEPLSKTAGAGGLRWRDAYSTGLSCGLRLLRDDSPQVWPVDEMEGMIYELSSFTPCGRIGF